MNLNQQQRKTVNDAWSTLKSTISSARTFMKPLEYFQDLLNRDSFVDKSVLNSIPQHTVRDELGNPPTLDEVDQAIKKSKNNRSSDADGIPTETFKQRWEELTLRLHALI